MGDTRCSLHCFQKSKAEEKDLIMSITVSCLGTTLGMRKPKGKQEEKVSLLLHLILTRMHYELLFLFYS